jgi:hypothetical protein
VLYPVLCVHEVIEVESNEKNSSMQLYSDSMAADTIFCVFGFRIYQVQIEIYRALEKEHTDNVEFDNNPALVRKLLECQEYYVSD